MEDMAKLYAPAAARSFRNEDWMQAAALTLERCQKLDMALQSLTPGGSEYVGDPDRCVSYIREQINKGREVRLELARLKNPRNPIMDADELRRDITEARDIAQQFRLFWQIGGEVDKRQRRAATLLLVLADEIERLRPEVKPETETF